MSQFWEKLSDEHSETLGEHGLNSFRKTIAPRYFTDLRKENEESIRKMYAEVVAKGIEVIDDPCIGDPFVVEIDGKNVTQDVLVSLNEAASMPLAEVKSIVEFGAGYGRTAYAILKQYPHIKYAIVDVVPAIDISRAFLNKALPGNTIEFRNSYDEIPKADLYIAISMLSELAPEEVDRYLSVKGLFYIKDWKSWYNPDDNVTIGTERYDKLECLFSRDDPFTEGFFEALYRL